MVETKPRDGAHEESFLTADVRPVGLMLQRMKPSWTISSASATDPSIR